MGALWGARISWNHRQKLYLDTLDVQSSLSAQKILQKKKKKIEEHKTQSTKKDKNTRKRNKNQIVRFIALGLTPAV